MSGAAPPPRSSGDDPPGEDLLARMRGAVASAVALNAARLRTASAPAVIGILSAAALTPVFAVSVSSGVLLTAGAGVAGSIGGNFATDVLRNLIDRLREPAGAADRIEAAFSAVDPGDRELRDAIITLFRTTDLAGMALHSAAGHGTELRPALGRAFVELTPRFEEFAAGLAGSRTLLEELHREFHLETARLNVDRDLFRQIAADIGRVLDLIRERQVTAPAVTAEPGPRWEGNPYVGLPPFQQHHARVFHGRRMLTRRLAGRLAEHLENPGLLAVIGSSGAGKSSLLSAGLLTALADGRMLPGSETWPTILLEPTAEPLRQLAMHLAGHLGIDAVTLSGLLAGHPDQAGVLAGQALLRSAVPGRRLVIVVDQLEELFTEVTDPEVQTAFVSALHSLATLPVQPGGCAGALVVCSLRGDFLDRAMAFPPLRAAVDAGPFTVGAMSEAELGEAITGPAAEAGVRLPDDLVTRILDDLRDRNLPVGFDSGALPLLSHVLFTMWQAAAGRPITLEHYVRTGGVADIVRTSADAVYADLPPDQRETARRLFVHLAASTDGRLTRRRATRAVLHAVAGPHTGTVLEAFAAQRLIILTGDTVDLAHEELLRSWHTLRDWMDARAADLTLHRALVDDAHSWEGARRDSSYLYRGAQLAAFQEAGRRWDRDPAAHCRLDPVSADFLDTGQRRDRRRRRVYRTVVAAMSLLLVATAGVSVLAVTYAVRAGDQHDLALSRQLAINSVLQRDLDWALAQQLAAAALKVAPTTDARDAAHALMAAYRTVLAPPGGITASAYSPDGGTIATGTGQGQLWVWEAATRTLRHRSQAGRGRLDKVVYSPDSGTVATVSQHDGTIRLWNTTTGAVAGTIGAATARTPSGIVFTPDGRAVLIGYADEAGVQIRDVRTGGLVRTLGLHGTNPLGLVLSPDGQRLVVRSRGERIRIWNTGSGEPMSAPIEASFLRVDRIAFSPDGRYLAVLSSGEVLLMSGRNGRLLRVLQGDWNSERYAGAMAFSPDGSVIAAEDGRGRLTMRRVADGTRAGIIATPGADFHDVMFSPDGRTVVNVTARANGGAGYLSFWDARTYDSVSAVSRDSPVVIQDGPDGRVSALRKSVPVAGLRSPAERGSLRNFLLRGQYGNLEAGPGGTLLASIGEPGSGSCTGRNCVVVRWNSSLAVSPDARLMALGDKDRVRLWAPVTGQVVRTIAVTGDVVATAFSPDGRTLAVRAGETTRTWDVATGQPAGFGTITTGRRAFPGGSNDLMAFHPTAGFLAVIADDGRIRYRDPVTGLPVADVRPPAITDVDSLAFSPDGRILATADNFSVHLWNAVTGELIGTLGTRLGYGFEGLAFSPDGDRLIGVTRNEPEPGIPVSWEVPLYLNPVERLCAQAGGISRADWARFAPGEQWFDVCRPNRTPA
ncbi:MAG TPA: hypothetical protein VN408_29000 [Actinoplanes sp.]|nr:hypothetical protein [Actinoplanes sp.]